MKNKIFFKTALSLLMLAVATTSLHAQKKSASIKFSCVIWKPLAESQLYYRQGEKYFPLNLSPGNRSELYELKGVSVLGIYTRVESEKGQMVYKLVGKSSIPTGISRMLFFITERNDPDELPLRLSGVDDSLLTFPRGACRFVNLTSVPLSVTFAGKRNIIKPKGMTVVKSKVRDDGGLLPFLIRDSKGNNLYENRYFAQQIGRDMIFILPPNRQGGRVIVKLLPQLIAREPVKKIN